MEEIIYSNIQTKIECGYCGWDWDTTFERWNLVDDGCIGSCSCQAPTCSSSCSSCSLPCI